MVKNKLLRTVITGALGISIMTVPVLVYGETVGPGGSVEVDEGGEVDYDSGVGNKTDHIDIDDTENTNEETSQSGANGSTNQTYVDDRTQDEKDLNAQYVQLRDLVASWKNKCNGPLSYLESGNSGDNITTIQYGHLQKSDIEQAKGYLDSFNTLRTTGDVDDYWSDYYYEFDLRDSSSGYYATSSPSVTGVDTLKSEEMNEIRDGIINQNGLKDVDTQVTGVFTPGFDLMTGPWNPTATITPNGWGIGVSAPEYVNGTAIRTDLVPGGLHNASADNWYKDIESLYRYFDLQVPESMEGAHGTFQSNAMNDFCSIALIRNYKVQEVVQEREQIGDPISDDYQIHLFSVDESGNRTEIDVLDTNQRVNTIRLSNYPGAKKIVAQTFRRFNLTTYTRVSYAEYEYLIDVGTNNILWYSEHSMESNSVGKTGCRTITMNVSADVSDWIADPNEAEITIRNLTDLTENDTITERID